MKKSLSLIGSACLLLAGCFSVEHQLPPHTYFGRMPERPDERVVGFEREGMKNWFLAGLMPYTEWSTQDLLKVNSSPKRVENLAIETEFSTFDVAVSIFPGLFYVYYLWAPRTIRVSGMEVRERR